MQNIAIGKIYTYFFAFIFISFILIGLQIVGDLAVEIILLLSVFLYIVIIHLFYKNGVSLKRLSLYLPFFLYLSTYIVNYNGAAHWIYYQFLLVLMCFVISNIKWKESQFRLFSTLSLFSLLIVVYFTFIETDILNFNTLGAYAFFLSYFVFLYYINKSGRFKIITHSIIIVLMGILILETETRSIMMSVFFLLITLLIWKHISKSKLLFNLYLIFIILFCVGFTVIYPNLDRYFSGFYQFNLMIIELTGKSIFSGRDVIWAGLIELLGQNKWFGYGSGVYPETFFDTTQSAHNLYLQIALQVGLVGLILFGWFIFKIWNALWINRYDKKVILSASFIIGILIYQLSEVSLVQNNFILGFLQWIIIGFALSFSIGQGRGNSLVE